VCDPAAQGLRASQEETLALERALLRWAYYIEFIDICGFSALRQCGSLSVAVIYSRHFNGDLAVRINMGQPVIR
jgi:hypothetical protein